MPIFGGADEVRHDNDEKRGEAGGGLLGRAGGGGERDEMVAAMNKEDNDRQRTRPACLPV